MNVPLNFGILKNPINWVTVYLMVTIAALAFHLIFPTTAPKAET